MQTLAEKCCTDNVCRLVLVLGAVTVDKEEPTEKCLCWCLSERYLGTGCIFPVITIFMLHLRTANLIEHKNAVINRHRTVFIPLSLTPPAEKVSICIDQIFQGQGFIWCFDIEDHVKFQFKLKKISSCWIHQIVGVSWAFDHLILFSKQTVNGTNGVLGYLI